MPLQTYVVPKKSYPTKYRAFFKGGGYMDYDHYDEAKVAFSPMRGPVVQVDRIETATLWVAPEKEVITP